MGADYRERIKGYEQLLHHERVHLKALRDGKDLGIEEVATHEKDIEWTRQEIRRLNDLRQLAFQVITDLELLDL